MTRRLLVCDLDNTLYDWVDYFVSAFYAMVDEAVRITGWDKELLLDEMREVHQRHHDSEHPFSLLETSLAQNLLKYRSKNEVTAYLDPALHAFNSVRKRTLREYPFVTETLTAIKDEGVTIVAHTESKLYAVIDRLRRLNLHRFFSAIYCRERPTTPHPKAQVFEDWTKEFPMDIVVELMMHQRKPDRAVLLEICSRSGFKPEETVYVGDSMARDMLMAKSAGVLAIWAKYGVSSDKSKYEKLVRVTHWTADDVLRERELTAKSREIKPDVIAETSFAEILPVFVGNCDRAVSSKVDGR